MAVHKYLSPTGKRIVATCDSLLASASIEGIDDEGVPLYDGAGSRVHWDTQETRTKNGQLLYEDEDGDEWPFDQLVKDEEIPAEEDLLEAMERDDD